MRPGIEATTKSVTLVWNSNEISGEIIIHNGTLSGIACTGGTVNGQSFRGNGTEPVRILLSVEDAHLVPGAGSTRVTAKTSFHTFSFFLRDVHTTWPVWIPEYGVAVTASGDTRSYNDIAAAIRAKGTESGLQKIAAEPEESYEAACSVNRNQQCPTWLGVGRDMRIFQMHIQPEYGYWGAISPRYHTLHPEKIDPAHPDKLLFTIGRGAACMVDITRRLEEGVLPILTSVQKDGAVAYHLTAFATLESRPLGDNAVQGTEWRAAYAHTGNNMLTEDELKELEPVLNRETTGREEEVVCCTRIIARNTGRMPQYAWFKAITGHWSGDPAKTSDFNGATGMSEACGLVLAAHRIDGNPMPQAEMAILIAPGESVEMVMLIPHRPLPAERMTAAAGIDVDAHLDACRAFWKNRLRAGGSIRVPEPAVDERIRAGLLHCDLVTLGQDADGPLLPTIGWYAPIGSESAPIIQFFDSIGWSGIARRCLEFFLARQRPDGFMQNYGGYQLETGPVLWSMGEHYRYTRDDEWILRNGEKILKACAYLLEWRTRNMRDELKGQGYGLQDGKVADPDDFFHSFMLNALSYLGIARAGEMLAAVFPEEAARLTREADAYRDDIRAAFREALAQSPVIPTGDGTWVPAPPPWSGQPGAVSLYAEEGECFTHGAFGSRDSLIGPLYLVIGECFDAAEPEADFLNRAHHELFTVRNAGLTQPYYCRHDYIHLRRGEVKAFLKTFYNQFTAIQDRETYTFWEHYHHASQHKTHEEGWFLMQVRWMLWFEEDRTLKLLSAVPRKWLGDGKTIELENVATHFGPLSLKVSSRLAASRTIEADIACPHPGHPEEVVIRIPHPDGNRAVTTEGGTYNPDAETVRITGFTGRARVILTF